MSDEEILMGMFVEVESIKGRKRLQKMVYILKSLGLPVSASFVKYHYGPYSKELEVEVSGLTNQGVLGERSDTYLMPDGIHRVYDYSLTAQGQKYAREYGADLSEYSDLLKKLKDMDLDELVKIAYYIHDSNPKPEAIKKRIEEMK